MQDRHLKREQYFREQAYTTSNYVIPFISEHKDVNNSLEVLEIGCGEGGNLEPFMDAGCRRVVGLDLSDNKINNARKFLSEHPNAANLSLIRADIYDSLHELGQFDLIITRDVLEHIHDQDRFMKEVKVLLKPEGKMFLGFPPWHNPFGGHQQMCESRILSKLPYFHLLPRPLYAGVLKLFGEKDKKIENLLEIKDTGISIERFERILRKRNYQKDKRIFYFINPNYEVKFKLKPRKQVSLINAIPILRNFLITTNYYLVSDQMDRQTKN